MTKIGFVCGGIISKSTFDSDPWAYMMCYFMDDDRFAEYTELCKEPGMEKERIKFFNKHKLSAI